MQLLITVEGVKLVDTGAGEPVSVPEFVPEFVGVMVPSMRSAIAQIVVPLMSAKPLQLPERIMVMQLPMPSCTQARTMEGVTGRPSKVPRAARVRAG